MPGAPSSVLVPICFQVWLSILLIFLLFLAGGAVALLKSIQCAEAIRDILSGLLGLEKFGSSS